MSRNRKGLPENSTQNKNNKNGSLKKTNFQFWSVSSFIIEKLSSEVSGQTIKK
jgi:hypothetical protein